MKILDKISDLIPDEKNARKHTERNTEMISRSIEEVGMARSGVVDENGTILAGNATFEAASKLGIKKIKVVDGNGNEWVVVRRVGLTPEQKTRLSLADNRTSEMAEWAPEVLAQLREDGLLTGMFDEAELKSILGEIAVAEGIKESDTDSSDPQHTCPSCGYGWRGKKRS